jgi:hypothetical protein
MMKRDKLFEIAVLCAKEEVNPKNKDIVKAAYRRISYIINPEGEEEDENEQYLEGCREEEGW